MNQYNLQKNTLKPDITVWLFLLIVVSLGFNYELTETPAAIYICHVVWITFFSLYFLSVIAKMSSPRLAINNIIIFFGLFLILSIHGAIGIHNAEPIFFREFIKYIFSFTLFGAFVLLFGNRSFNLTFLALSVGLGVLISTFTLAESSILGWSFINADNLHKNRLDILKLGGPNVYSFLVANAILCAIFLQRINAKKIIKSMVLFAIIGYLLLVLLSTFSRNGMLGLMVGLATFFYITLGRLKFFTMLTIVSIVMTPIIINLSQSEFSIIAFRYILDPDLLTGTGRVRTWLQLISEMFAQPYSIVFGSGIGTVDLEIIGSNTRAQSAHNQFLQFQYEFGFFIFTIIIVFFGLLLKRLLMISDTNNRAFLVAVLVQIFVTLMFDSTLQASQVGWFFALWFSLLYTQSQLSKNFSK